MSALPIPGLAVLRSGTPPDDMVFIEGEVVLPSWAASTADGKGTVAMAVGGDMVLDVPEVTPGHVRAYAHLTAQQSDVKAVLLTALLPWYNEQRVELADGYFDMPPIDGTAALEEMITLSTVHLLNVYREDMAYVGYEFTCPWEEEHGLGVMMHGDRVVSIGHADQSFLTWVAREDGGEE